MPFRRVGTAVASMALGVLGILRRRIVSNVEGSGVAGWGSGEGGTAAAYQMSGDHIVVAMNPVDNPTQSETILAFPAAVEDQVDAALAKAQEKWKRQVEGVV